MTSTRHRPVGATEAARFLQELEAGATPVEGVVFADDGGDDFGVAVRGDLGFVPWFPGYLHRALDAGMTAGAVGFRAVAGPTAGSRMPSLFSVEVHDDGRLRRLHLLLDDLTTLPARVFLSGLLRFGVLHLWPDPPVEGTTQSVMLPFRLSGETLAACADARDLIRAQRQS
jgi:hypothetical protein